MISENEVTEDAALCEWPTVICMTMQCRIYGGKSPLTDFEKCEPIGMAKKLTIEETAIKSAAGNEKSKVTSRATGRRKTRYQ